MQFYKYVCGTHSRTPRWVHVDNRWVGSGYPITRMGSKDFYLLNNY